MRCLQLSADLDQTYRDIAKSSGCGPTMHFTRFIFHTSEHTTNLLVLTVLSQSNVLSTVYYGSQLDDQFHSNSADLRTPSVPITKQATNFSKSMSKTHQNQSKSSQPPLGPKIPLIASFLLFVCKINPIICQVSPSSTLFVEIHHIFSHERAHH